MPAAEKPHYDWTNKRLNRWKRRAISIPIAIVLALVVVSLSPLLLAAAIIADVAEGMRKWRWVRILGFAVFFAVLELTVIALGAIFWVATGFGLLLHTEGAQSLHRRTQLVWCELNLRAVQFLMSTTISYIDIEQGAPGPTVALARHTSMGDAFIPMVVMGSRNNLILRVVLKNDLIHLPSIDLFGHRLPNHFVDRAPTNSESELEPIRRIARGIDEHSTGVIFPEGTFRTPVRFERALESIAKADPSRAERVSTLKHVLPFRPGGTLAYLDGAPDADLVFIAHTGFEKFHTFKEIIANVPFEHDVPVKLWRVDRSEVPDSESERIVWLDKQWQLLDNWVNEEVANRRGNGV